MGSPIPMMNMGNMGMPNQMGIINPQMNFNQQGMMGGSQQPQQSPQQQAMQSPGNTWKNSISAVKTLGMDEKKIQRVYNWLIFMKNERKAGSKNFVFKVKTKS